MTVRTVPSFLQASSHPAEETRLMVGGLLGSPASAFAGGVGATDPGHGVTTAPALAVAQNGTPNMSVNVAAGGAFIRGTQSTFQGVYHIVNDGVVNLAIAAADPTNPRRDLIIAQVRDAAYSGAVNDARLTVVTGTPAASPADPSLAAFPNALVLARVAVAAAASSIVTANITDLRSATTGLDGMFVCTSTTRPATPYKGMQVWETDTGRMMVYYGATTGWAPPWGSAWGKVDSINSAVDVAIAATVTTVLSSNSVTLRSDRVYEVTATGYLFSFSAAGSMSLTPTFCENVTTRVNLPPQFQGVTDSNNWSVAFTYTPASTVTTNWRIRFVGSAVGTTFKNASATGYLTIKDLGPVSATPPTD